jgi:hypothetical protein
MIFSNRLTLGKAAYYFSGGFRANTAKIGNNGHRHPVLLLQFPGYFYFGRWKFAKLMPQLPNYQQIVFNDRGIGA